MSYLFQVINFIELPYIYLTFIAIILALISYNYSGNKITFIIVIFAFVFIGFISNIYPEWLFLLVVFSIITFSLLPEKSTGDFRI
jgi:hypothetical protein